ncbi:hypothetical protein [Microbacterium azadirachtae]|uniref:hypothetical protein n=1 Tax=Microbacterium azadirachtae TaxID=582680 RepID=UPI0008903C20|nr:hypothetical protein [Microbacterium azadirachtae]SDL62381.1 hypothetical protein SAMN04488593_1357 [Microbacterium azadirachtae]SEF91243.1 hypothetical protein SAMN04488594_1344 [Microbacterium azadirachtae]SEF93267.1 hypothetical protein SAMN04488592_1354 [Microbacterium azadirachtae]
MTEAEAAELAARIEQDLLAEPGISAVYPASGGGRLREVAAKLRGADDAARVVVRPGEVAQVEVALGLDDARPAGETARAAQRIIRRAASVPVRIRLTVAHLDVAPPEQAVTTTA